MLRGLIGRGGHRGSAATIFTTFERTTVVARNDRGGNERVARVTTEEGAGGAAQESSPKLASAPWNRCGPVWVAPMAGGPSRPELVIAAARAGHFAQLAAGYKTADAMSAEIRQVREAGVDLFGVNLFVPNPHPVVRDDYDAYAESLRATAQRVGYAGDPAALREDDDDWDAKIAALLADPVPVVSFTFGLPPSASSPSCAPWGRSRCRP